MSTKVIVEVPNIYFNIPRKHRQKSKEEMLALREKARKNGKNLSNPVDCQVFRNSNKYQPKQII